MVEVKVEPCYTVFDKFNVVAYSGEVPVSTLAVAVPQWEAERVQTAVSLTLDADRNINGRK